MIIGISNQSPPSNKTKKKQINRIFLFLSLLPYRLAFCKQYCLRVHYIQQQQNPNQKQPNQVKDRKVLA